MCRRGGGSVDVLFAAEKCMQLASVQKEAVLMYLRTIDMLRVRKRIGFSYV